jgi:hypothetical protein
MVSEINKQKDDSSAGAAMDGEAQGYLPVAEQGKDESKPGEVKCDGCAKYYPQAMTNSFDVAPMYPGVGFIVTFCPSCMARRGREI